MSLIDEVGLDLDQLQACLNQWMTASAQANQDLEHKNQALRTQTEAIRMAGATSTACLNEVDGLREALNKTTSRGRDGFLEHSQQMLQALHSGGTTRTQQTRGSVEQLGQTLETCKGLIQASLASQSRFAEQVAQLSKMCDQAREQLLELDKNAQKNLDELDNTLHEMNTSLKQNGQASATNVGKLTSFLDECGRTKVPESVAKVVSWLADSLQVDHLKIVEGVHQGADAALTGFKQKVSQTLAPSAQAVSAALTTASSEIHSARQSANQQFNSRSLPLYAGLMSDQNDVFRGFHQAGVNLTGVGQKLGEIRGKYEAVARNVPR